MNRARRTCSVRATYCIPPRVRKRLSVCRRRSFLPKKPRKSSATSENNDCYFNEEAAAFIDKPKGQSGGFGGDSSEDDEVDYVYIDALRNVILSGSASISLVQRKCSVGYNKAGKIIEWMEDQGYISAFDGAKARKVLITPEQFEEKYGPL